VEQLSSAAVSEQQCSPQFYDQCARSSTDRRTTTQSWYSEVPDTAMWLQTIPLGLQLQTTAVVTCTMYYYNHSGCTKCTTLKTTIPTVIQQQKCTKKKVNIKPPTTSDLSDLKY